MKEFKQKQAETYLNKLIKKYKIKIHTKRSVSSCGWANWFDNEIKIPYPTDVDRFGVCLHEVKHIIDGDRGKRYQQEFWCDLWSLNILKEFQYDTDYWERRMRWHVLSSVAMATNRGLKKVDEEICNYFSDVDFSNWCGKRVFVSCDKKISKIEISVEEK